MRSRYKVLLVSLGVIVLLGLVGVGVALAAPSSPSSSYQKLFVSKLAKILGKDEQQVGDAVVQARTEAMNETLDEAVKAGRLTKEQAEAMKQHMQQGGSGMMGPGMMGPGGMMGSGADHCGGAGTGSDGAKSGGPSSAPLQGVQATQL